MDVRSRLPLLAYLAVVALALVLLNNSRDQGRRIERIEKIVCKNTQNEKVSCDVYLSRLIDRKIQVAQTSPLQGNDGATGPAGEAGPRGRIGKTGPRGPAGTNGIDGSNGRNGSDGARGRPGPPGPVGPRGPAGLPGVPGAPDLTPQVNQITEQVVARVCSRLPLVCQ